MFCQKCGMEVASSYKFCPKCGGKDFVGSQAALTANQPVPVSMPHNSTGIPIATHILGVEYASFWRRLGAYMIDYIITVLASLVLGVAFGILFGLVMHDISEKIAIGLGYVIGGLFGWFYFALMESGPHQATLGKKWLDMKVTDENGQRITFWNATGRLFAKIVSSLIIGIGFLMILWTEKRQGLHDKLASTYVFYVGGR